MLLIPESPQCGRCASSNRGIFATQSTQCVRQLPQFALQLSMYVYLSHVLLDWNNKFQMIADLRKDLRACAEIVKSCSELEMPLNELQNEQFLSLFLDQSEPYDTAAAGNRTTGNKYKTKSFQYKF